MTLPRLDYLANAVMARFEKHPRHEDGDRIIVILADKDGYAVVANDFGDSGDAAGVFSRAFVTVARRNGRNLIVTDEESGVTVATAQTIDKEQTDVRP